MFGDKMNVGGGPLNDDRFSLDKMNLDRVDNSNNDTTQYDPFFKGNVLSLILKYLQKMDLELQAQMNIMNKKNTIGG